MGAIEDFGKRLGELAGGKLQDKIDQAVAEELEATIRASSNAGEDPYGRPWEETELGARPLRGVAQTVSVRAQNGGVEVEVGDPTMVFHQGGTTRGLPARPVLPDGGLPSAWSEAIARATKATLAGGLGGG